MNFKKIKNKKDKPDTICENLIVLECLSLVFILKTFKFKNNQLVIIRRIINLTIIFLFRFSMLLTCI